MPISLSGSLNLSGSLTTTGTITAQTLVVQTITSSISSITGSTNFGSLSINNHTFTGSLLVSGSVSSTGAATFSSSVTATNGIFSQAMTNGSTGAFTNPNLALKATSTTDTTGFIGMTFATSDNANYGYSYGALRDSGGVGDLVWRNHFNSAQGTELMRLKNNGNVGIGTSSPNIGGYGANGRILTIQGISGSYGILELTSNSANADGNAIGRLDFGSDGQAANYKAISSIASFLTGSTSTKFGADLRFYTRVDNAVSGDPSERMRIISGGNVLIGTTTDNGRKLQVAGGALFTGGSSSGASFNIIPDAAGQNGVDLNTSYFTGTGFGPLTFTLGGAERMRITSAGQVGIGGTPSSWDTVNVKVLQLKGTALWTFGSGVASFMSSNIYYDGSVRRYIYADYAVEYAQNAGSHIWYSNPAGTAGDSFTPIERMRITSAGNVTIGTNAVPSGATEFNNGSLFTSNNIFVNNSSGTAGYAVRIDGYSNNLYVLWSTAAGADNGGVGLAYGATGWSPVSSDARTKKNFETTQGLAEILQIEPIKYHLLSDEDNAVKRLGFKAQNLEPLIPEMVHETGKKLEDGSDILTITPDYILPVLVKAIQELTARVQYLENK